VRAALAELKAAPPRHQITEAFNFVDPVQENYDGSMTLLYEGAALAVLVVWWFLRDWRATWWRGGAAAVGDPDLRGDAPGWASRSTSSRC
jgi:hypothetical protein